MESRFKRDVLPLVPRGTIKGPDPIWTLFYKHVDQDISWVPAHPEKPKGIKNTATFAPREH